MRHRAYELLVEYRIQVVVDVPRPHQAVVVHERCNVRVRHVLLPQHCGEAVSVEVPQLRAPNDPDTEEAPEEPLLGLTAAEGGAAAVVTARAGSGVRPHDVSTFYPRSTR